MVVSRGASAATRAYDMGAAGGLASIGNLRVQGERKTVLRVGGCGLGFGGKGREREERIVKGREESVWRPLLYLIF